MNERVMQFRIGMFVIVAGLVLTMLIVWFGESPTLFRDQVYVTAHYVEAPGVAEGIPVRKSGIRIGEVTLIRFDDRPRMHGTVFGRQGDAVIVDLGPEGKGLIPVDQFRGRPPGPGAAVDVVVNRRGEAGAPHALCLPDGVLVTIALERRFQLLDGSVPRVSRALIGDVSIDMLPGDGPDPLPTANRASKAPVIEGQVAPDPANALAAATEAFQDVKGTLQSISDAARGLAAMTKKTENLDEMIVSFRDMGKKVGVLSEDLDRIVKDNEADFKPAMTNLREAAEKFNQTLDPKTRANLQAAANNLASGSAKLDKILTDLGPVASDLSADPRHKPTTNVGQAMMRLNRIAYDISKLTEPLTDNSGRLNPNGTLQRLVLQADLYDNLNQVAISAQGVLKNLNRFAERVANDPGALSRGAFQR